MVFFIIDTGVLDLVPAVFTMVRCTFGVALGVSRGAITIFSALDAKTKVYRKEIKEKLKQKQTFVQTTTEIQN